MKTAEKPKIESKTVTIPVQRYGALIAKEKRALPELQKQIKENNRLKKESHVTMMSRRRKRT